MSGTIRKRGKASFELRFDVPTEDGSRDQRSVTVRGSKHAARRELRRLMAEADKGLLPKRSALTLGTYMKEWLEGAKASRSRTTIERYAAINAKQIEPLLGEIELQRLRPEDVLKLHATLMSDDHKLSAHTVLHVHKVLKLALGFAVKTGTLSRNVATLVGTPQPEHREMSVLQPGEAERLLEGLRGHSLYPIVALALYTGMRRGELLGLQWGDVNLDKGTIRVERSLEQTKAAGIQIKATKTEAGRRTIALARKAIEVLREHRVTQLQVRMVLQMGRPGPSDLVFCTPDFTPLSPENVSSNFYKVVRRNGLPVIRFHDLRHTCVSALVASGLDVITVSRMMGHVNPTITLNTYSHMFGDGDSRAAAALDKAFGGQ
jgi:integrase